MRIFLICSALLSIVNSVPLPQNQSGALQPQIQPVPAGPPGRPIGPPPPAGPQTTPVPIISQTDIDNGEGNFTFGFVAGNGISVQESGYIRQVFISGRSGGSNIEGAADEDNSIQVLTGSYSYTAPDGTNITLTYVADENGFQPQGEHLPTPPPIPESVQRLLSSLPQNLAPADQGALSVRTGKALDSVSLGATNTANVVAAPVVASVPLSATVSGAAPGASVSVGPARGSGEIAVDASASSPLVASALTAVASDSPVVQISPADKVVS